MKEPVRTKPICSKRDELMFYRDQGRSARFGLSEGGARRGVGARRKISILTEEDIKRRWASG